MYACMDGWLDGWMHGQTDARMDRFIDALLNCDVEDLSFSGAGFSGF